jgi:large subunit ribosomal protein L23
VIFEVTRESDQAQIRAAVEGAFGVKVLDVRTMIVRGKMKRMGRGYAKTQNWKKAIVTLREGDKIAAFEPPTE